MGKVSKCPEAPYKDVICFRLYRAELHLVLRGQKVCVHESCYSFCFLLRCFESLLQQDVPASNLVGALGSVLTALGFLLKAISVKDCQDSEGIWCLLSFDNETKQPIIWAAERDVLWRGR